MRVMTGKKLLIAILLLGLSKLLMAQEAKKVENLPKFDLADKHFGFYLSGNEMFFVVKPTESFQQTTWNRGQIPDLVGDSARVYGIRPALFPAFPLV